MLLASSLIDVETPSGIPDNVMNGIELHQSEIADHLTNYYGSYCNVLERFLTASCFEYVLSTYYYDMFEFIFGRFSNSRLGVRVLLGLRSIYSQSPRLRLR